MNKNYDANTKKTSSELYQYYKAPNYFNRKGYTSKYYGKTYYDGYGYNFYNGNYGYYEYSRPPVAGVGPEWKISSFLTMLACFTGILGTFTLIYYHYETRQQRKKTTGGLGASLS